MPVLVIVFVLVGAGGAHAQGLLLGAGDTTYYVARRANGWSMLKRPGYWVPRKEGFWKVEVTVPTHLFPKATAAQLDSMEHSSEDTGCFGTNLIAYRAGSAPHFGRQDPDCLADRSEHGELLLTFLGPEHVSFTKRYTATVGGAFMRSFVTWIDTLVHYGFAGEAADTLPQYRFEIDSVTEQSRWRQCAPARDGDFSFTETTSAEGGSILRYKGRWVYAQTRVGSRGGLTAACEMPLKVSDTLIGFREAHFDWQELRGAARKDAMDSFVAPTRDVVGILYADGQLKLYALTRGKPGELLTEKQLRVREAPTCPPNEAAAEPECAVVMVQWATGVQVERWWNLLSRISRN